MDTEREDKTHDQQMEIDQQLDAFYQHNEMAQMDENDYQDYSGY